MPDSIKFKVPIYDEVVLEAQATFDVLQKAADKFERPFHYRLIDVPAAKAI